MSNFFHGKSRLDLIKARAKLVLSAEAGPELLAVEGADLYRIGSEYFNPFFMEVVQKLSNSEYEAYTALFNKLVNIDTEIEHGK